MKKIAISHPKLGRGGSEACALWLIQALKDDYDVTLVTGGDVDLDGLNAFYGTSLKYEDFKISQAPIPWIIKRIGRGDVLWGSLFQRYYANVGKNFDLCISAYNSCDFGQKAIHFIGDFCWDDEIKRKLYPLAPGFIAIMHKKGLLRNLYLKFCKSFAKPSGRNMFIEDVFISNSYWTAKIMKEKYGCDEKVIYPPVIASYPEVAWQDRADEFVCIGRIDPAKRIERIINILESVRSKGYMVKLNIAGPVGQDAYGNKIRQMAEKHKDWIILHGSVWGERKEKLLTSCRYGIQGTEGEAFGISVAEMAKAGCIVFAPAEGGQAEIVNQEKLSFSSDEDAVTKICHVMEDDALQEQLRTHLKSQAKLFSTDIFVSQAKNLIKQTLNNS